jgi:penicillin-binding protein 1C
MSKEAAFIVRDMLRQNPRPDVGGFRQSLPFYTGWKTGTSYGFKDGWTAVVFGSYVLAVWVGNFSGEGNPAFMGRQSAAPLAFHIARQLENPLNITDDPHIPYDLNIKYVDICAVTGELPLEHSPQLTRTLFIPGVSPIKVSDIFLKIPVDIATGLRACRYDPLTTRLEVHEFWPADIMELFRSAGIHKKTPPRYMPDCELDRIVHYGAPPVITFPQAGVIYDTGFAAEIPLSASAFGDATEIYWFVNGMYIGKSASGRPFFTKIGAGRHVLHAVDSLGRAVFIEFDVI